MKDNDNMSDIDYDKLGAAVARHMEHRCSLGLTKEDLEAFRELTGILSNWRTMKGKALSTVFTLVCVGFTTVIVGGIGMYAKRWLLGPGGH